MTSLTEAALFSKKTFFGGILFLALIITLIIFLGIGQRIKNALFPKPPAPASVAFGKLPAASFEDSYRSPGGTAFEIDTISGGLPALPSSAKVFGIKTNESFFGDIERIRASAENIGFSQEPIEISSGVLKFVDERDENMTLTVNTLSGSFTFDTNYEFDPDVLDGRVRSEESAKEDAVDFLERYGVDLSQFPLEKIGLRKLRIDGPNLTETPALANANLVEVNFKRGDLDEIPVYWLRDGEAGISVLVSERDVVFANYNPVPVLVGKFSTYPLRGVSLAFDDLRGGLGIFNRPLETSTVTIIDVSLGYVENEKTERFLEPFYIFKSAEEGFFGAVSAIDPIWLESTSSAR